MKIKIQSQADKASPVRLKSGRYTVSLSTRAEAKRVIDFIHKSLKSKEVHVGKS